MPIVRTRLQIEDRGRYLADATYDTNISDDDLHESLNSVLGSLHGVVFRRDPDRFIAMATISTTEGTREYELPDDFMSIRRIDWVNGDDREMLLEAPGLLEMDLSQNGGGSNGACQYRVMGSGMDGSAVRLYLAPDPGTETYQLWYVQGPPTMDNDADELDVVSSWHDYIAQGLAAEIRERQQRDSTPHRLAQQLAREDIEAEATKRDSGRPKRPTDVRWGTNSARRRVPPYPNV